MIIFHPFVFEASILGSHLLTLAFQTQARFRDCGLRQWALGGGTEFEFPFAGVGSWFTATSMCMRTAECPTLCASSSPVPWVRHGSPCPHKRVLDSVRGVCRSVSVGAGCDWCECVGAGRAVGWRWGLRFLKGESQGV